MIGLGNPGPRHRANRHNAGFLVVEELARRLACRPWRRCPAYETTAVRVPAADPDGPARTLVLLKPMTFMNRSGEAVAAWTAANGDPADLLVVCDDLNLPLGSVRLRAGGGSGGQNGLAHILEVLGTPQVPRLRLGIAPRDLALAPQDWADYVLEDFPAAQAPAVKEMVAAAAAAALCWAQAGWEAASSRCNVRIGKGPAGTPPDTGTPPGTGGAAGTGNDPDTGNGPD